VRLGKDWEGEDDWRKLARDSLRDIHRRNGHDSGYDRVGYRWDDAEDLSRGSYGSEGRKSCGCDHRFEERGSYGPSNWESRSPTCDGQCRGDFRGEFRANYGPGNWESRNTGCGGETGPKDSNIRQRSQCDPLTFENCGRNLDYGTNSYGKIQKRNGHDSGYERVGYRLEDPQMRGSYEYGPGSYVPGGYYYRRANEKSEGVFGSEKPEKKPEPEKPHARDHEDLKDSQSRHHEKPEDHHEEHHPDPEHPQKLGKPGFGKTGKGDFSGH
jgi:hypothetical protein